MTQFKRRLGRSNFQTQNGPQSAFWPLGCGPARAILDLLRLNQRTITLLGLLTVVLAVGLLIPRPALGQAENATVEIELAELGYTTVILTGPTGSASYNFSLPAHWTPQTGTSLQLNLVYDINSEASKVPGSLDVYLNEQILYTEQFFTSTHRSLDIDIPPEMLRLAEEASTNELTLNLQAETRCEEVLRAELAIHSSSMLHFEYQERPLTLDLALYPKPLYYRRSLGIEIPPTHLVLPPQPSEIELESAAMIAAGLGAHTRDKLPLEVNLSDNLPTTAIQQNLLLIGSPERIALLSQLDLPLSLRSRRSSLSSRMPAAVMSAQPFSYTLIVKNTLTTTQDFSVQDRLSPLAHVDDCQDCSQIAPGLLQWEIVALEPGQTASTVIHIIPDASLDPGETIEHTASLLDDIGQVINVDTLSTTIALETDGTPVLSPAKGPHFFALDDHGVPETDGIVLLAPSPWDARRALLVVTGLNDAALMHAAQALVDPGDILGMQGSYSIIQATRLITTSPLFHSQNITLDQMEYDDIVTLGRDNNIRLQFQVPQSRMLTEAAYMALHLAHGAAFDSIAATLEVRLNNLPIHSISLRPENASDAWTTIPLPDRRLKPGVNYLDIHIAADWPACMGEDEIAGFWMTLYNDSFFHLSFDYQETPPRVDLDGYPRFLATQPGLQNIVLLAPAQISLDEVKGIVRLFSFLGDALPGEYLTPQVALSSEATPEQWQGMHMILLGRPARNPYIALVNDQLPQPFIPGRDEIRQQVNPVIYRLPPGYDLGLVQVLPVPWEKTRVMLLATGTTDTGLRWALDALTNKDLNRQLQGNLAAMVSADEMHTTDTRQQITDTLPIKPPSVETATLAPEATATPTVTPVPTLTPTPTPLTTVSVVNPTESAIIVKSEKPPQRNRPSWAIGLLAASAFAAVAGVIVALWQRRR